MYIEEKRKKVISLFLSLILLFQLIPGLMNFDTSAAESEVEPLENIKQISENEEFMKLEVLKDSEGNPNITEDSITWKLVYNKSNANLSEQNLKLVLSDHTELKYIDSEGRFDIANQLLFKSEVFDTFDSLLGENPSITYDVSEENRNNSEFVKEFYKSSENTYELSLSETDKTQELIFTTKLLDERTNEFYAYLLYEDEGIQIKTLSEVKVKPRTKVDIPVNISWNNIPEGITTPDTEIELLNGEEKVEKVTLVSGNNFTVFEDLYKYDVNGNEIDYSLSQITLDGYDTEIEGYDITNSYIEQQAEETVVIPRSVEGEGFAKFVVDSIEKSSKREEESIEKPAEELQEEIISDYTAQEVKDKSEEQVKIEIEADETDKELDQNQEKIVTEDLESKTDSTKNSEPEKIEAITENDIENYTVNSIKSLTDSIEEISKQEERVNQADVEKALAEMGNVGMMDLENAISKSSLLDTFSMESTMELRSNMMMNSTSRDRQLVGSGNIRYLGNIIPLVSAHNGSWNAYASFDGNNIIWEIEITKSPPTVPDILHTRGFSLANFANVSGVGPGNFEVSIKNNPEVARGALRFPSTLRTDQLLQQPLSNSTQTAVYKLITPMTSVQDSYSISVQPGITIIGNATGTLWETTSGSRVTLTVQRPIQKGTLSIRALGDDNLPMDGVMFYVTDLRTGKSYHAVTDSTGRTIVPNLDADIGNSYRIVQSTNKEGYLLPSPNDKVVTINEGSNEDVIIINPKIKKASISITLRASEDSNKTFANQRFTLYDSNNVWLKDGFTDSSGNLKFEDLEAGKYYYVQQNTYPEGYEADTPAIQRTEVLTVDGTTINYKNKMIPKESRKITLKYSDTGLAASQGTNVLPAGKFRVYEDGVMIQDDVDVDEYGNINLTDMLMPGKTYRVELTTLNTPYSDNYDMPAALEFIYKKDMPDGEMFLKKKVVQDTVAKVIARDSETGAAVPGIRVYWRLSDPAGSFNLVTLDSNGESYLAKNIYADKYKFYPGQKVVIRLDGNTEYLAVPEFISQPMVEGENIINIALVKRTSASTGETRLKVDISDQSGNTIPGARFRLTANDQVAGELGYVYEGTTDDAGNLYFQKLLPGSYTLEQIQAPFGYSIDSNKTRTINISSDATEVSESFINIKEPDKPVSDVLPTISPEYRSDGTGVDSGTYPVPYHQKDGNKDETALYRNRDNTDDGRTASSEYSVPAYSKYRYPGNTDISTDRDVIENDKGYLWKTATPTGIPGEYFIDLVVEGKETVSAPTTDIVLVLDNSNSMNSEKDGLKRIQNLEAAVKSFISEADLTDSENRIGIVEFNTKVDNIVPLTQNKSVLLSGVPTNAPKGDGKGGTFTQQALMEANKLLIGSQADNKVIILISDGVPTYSYKLNNTSSNSSVDGGWNYSNASLVSGIESRKGSGQYYEFSDTITIEAHKTYFTEVDNMNTPMKVLNHAYSAVSEAESIKNHGIEIYSLAVELEPQTVANGYDTVTHPGDSFSDPSKYVPKSISSKILQDISTGNDHFFDIDDSKNINEILSKLVPVTDKTIARGTITDPMGSQVILGKSSTGEFTRTSSFD